MGRVKRLDRVFDEEADGDTVADREAKRDRHRHSCSRTSWIGEGPGISEA